MRFWTDVLRGEITESDVKLADREKAAEQLAKCLGLQEKKPKETAPDLRAASELINLTLKEVREHTEMDWAGCAGADAAASGEGGAAVRV